MKILESLGNPNIPEEAKIIGSTTSGEIVYTYYWYHGDIYSVGDWVGEKSQKLNEADLNKLLGWIMSEVEKLKEENNEIKKAIKKY